MKNHYIPQFIIKNFSKAINVFNLKTASILENRGSNSVFYGRDIYDDEVEKILNYNLENEFSKLLTEKLLVDNSTVELTRKDLYLIKKYMLVSSIRAQGTDGLKTFFRAFTHNAERYFNLHPELNYNLQSINDLEIDGKDLLNRCLEVYCKCDTIHDLINNKQCTKEMLAFALPFLSSYLAFWDAPLRNEFVLSDIGMISEYEGIHQITGGLDLSKLSYLIHQIKFGKEDAIAYGNLLGDISVMYENYNIFNLSSRRCMIMVNPFFKLYYDCKVLIGKDILALPKPDIWPAIIQNQKLFEPPMNEYQVSMHYKTDKDSFFYKIKILTEEETIFLNSMLIMQSKSIIGFNNPQCIFNSIEFVINQKCHYNSVTSLNASNVEVFFNYLNHARKEPLQKLAIWCEKRNVKHRNDMDILFNNLLNNICKDMRNNPYIFEYLLDRKEETINCSQLDFLSQGNNINKLDYIKKEYYRILRERKKC